MKMPLAYVDIPIGRVKEQLKLCKHIRLGREAASSQCRCGNHTKLESLARNGALWLQIASPHALDFASSSGGIINQMGINSPVFNQLIPTPGLFTVYFLLANTIYLFRRSHLRKIPKRRLLKIRTTREEGVKIPLYIANIIAWQIFTLVVFPFLEVISRIFGYVSFYYFYPNASGCGIIFEPLAIQHLPMSKRTKQQIRLDWHRFSVNVGNVGRDGYRHPPSLERNLPHLDVPQLGWKHWPWRRRYPVAEARKSIGRNDKRGTGV